MRNSSGSLWKFSITQTTYNVWCLYFPKYHGTLRALFGSTTRVTRVSSDNVNIATEHQEPTEVLSQSDDTNTPEFPGSKSVASVATFGVLVTVSGAICDSFLFLLEIAVSTKILTSDGVPDKPGCFCRTTTRGVRLARQNCWFAHVGQAHPCLARALLQNKP